MRYRQLGDSQLEVSEICLGTMTFGQQNSEAEGHAQLDRALDYGVNFIDTAEMYSIPPRNETYGATERIIGNWLAKSGKRDRIILASKVVGQADWLPHIRDGKACLNRANIEQAIDGSLRRLQTDYLDLYQVHWPDRQTNFFGKLGYQYPAESPPASLEETLSALGGLVKAGKVRYIGVSNETPWGVMEYLRLSDKFGLPRIVSIQNPYNLLNRSYEIGLAEISHREQIPLLAYSPLGFGVLSGKYLDHKPEKARLSLFDSYKRYSTVNGVAATREYVELARKYGLSPAQMALAFVNNRPFVGANIIGATNLEQLQENLKSIELVLPEQLLDEIEAIQQRYPNPCP
ncbi:NADP(H)-dependent aldo-keto reductase [Methylomarinum vadi]|uniref:NADP(H)-dependent aldo-keto reductase n=1 Tax=Methylomarinum vadi TaxID=438855 RepID=UPI0004DF692B|nr:NADP(H)-dependent aldo-keto reductase [Methylomarinum vadi]